MNKKPIMSATKTAVETGASVVLPMLLANVSTVIGIIAGLIGLVYMTFKMLNEIHIWKKNNRKKRGEF